MAELIEKYQENENFAPKQNERDCPMTIKYRFMREHESVQT